MPKPKARTGQLLLLVGILLLALVLRVIIAHYGLPMLLYEDEPIYLRNVFPFGYGDFNPDYFKKPSFFLYFYFVFYYLFYLLGQVLHPFSSWAVFEAAYWQDPSTLALIGRSVGIGFAVGAVWLLYRLGRRGFSTGVGLSAAALLALDYTHLRHSAIVISDIPALFCILLTAWFALGVYAKGRLRDYLLCGLGVALTMSFKYNVFTVCFLLAAHLFRQIELHGGALRWRTVLLSKPLWAGLLVASTVFCLLNPYVLLNFQHFYSDIDLERRHMLLRDAKAVNQAFTLLPSFDEIFFRILPKAMGWPLYLAGLVGIPCLLGRYRWRAWVLLSFPVVFLLVVCQFRLINAKYLLPVFPFWYLAVSVLLRDFAGLIAARWKQAAWTRGVITACLLLLVSLPMVLASLQHVRLYSQPDTRVLALQALKQITRPEDLVLTEPETLPLAWKTNMYGSRFAAFNCSGGICTQKDPLRALESSDIKCLHPRFIVVAFRTEENAAGEKTLPQPDGYYAYLKAHYRIRALYASHSFKNVPSSTILAEKLNHLPDYLAAYRFLRANRDKRLRNGPWLLLLEREKPAPSS